MHPISQLIACQTDWKLTTHTHTSYVTCFPAVSEERPVFAVRVNNGSR